MATPQQQQELIALTTMMFNAPPGATYLAQLEAQLDAGQSLEQIAVGLSQTPLFNSQFSDLDTDKEKIDLVLSAVGIDENSPAYAEAFGFFETSLASGVSPGAALQEAASFLNTTQDENFSQAATTFRNKVDVGVKHTIELGLTSENLNELKTVVEGVTDDPQTVTQKEQALEEQAQQGDEEEESSGGGGGGGNQNTVISGSLGLTAAEADARSNETFVGSGVLTLKLTPDDAADLKLPDLSGFTGTLIIQTSGTGDVDLLQRYQDAQVSESTTQKYVIGTGTKLITDNLSNDPAEQVTGAGDLVVRMTVDPLSTEVAPSLYNIKIDGSLTFEFLSGAAGKSLVFSASSVIKLGAAGTLTVTGGTVVISESQVNALSTNNNTITGTGNLRVTGVADNSDLVDINNVADANLAQINAVTTTDTSLSLTATQLQAAVSTGDGQIDQITADGTGDITITGVTSADIANLVANVGTLDADGGNIIATAPGDITLTQAQLASLSTLSAFTVAGNVTVTEVTDVTQLLADITAAGLTDTGLPEAQGLADTSLTVTATELDSLDGLDATGSGNMILTEAESATLTADLGKLSVVNGTLSTTLATDEGGDLAGVNFAGVDLLTLSNTAVTLNDNSALPAEINANSVEITLADGGVNLSAVNVTNYGALVLLDDTTADTYTLTAEQHNGFAANTVTGNDNEITLTTAGTVTGVADVAKYTLAAGVNNFELGALAQHVDANADGDDTLIFGAGAYAGTIETASNDTISIIDGTKLSDVDAETTGAGSAFNANTLEVIGDGSTVSTTSAQLGSFQSSITGTNLTVALTDALSAADFDNITLPADATIELFDAANTLTTVDSLVSSGDTITIDGSGLTAGHALNFNGSAETNGNFVVTGGAAADGITGGDGADIITGGGGADSLVGGAGDDTFIIDTAQDVVSGLSIDGGADSDTIRIDTTDAIDLRMAALTGLELLDLSNADADVTLTWSQLYGEITINQYDDDAITVTEVPPGFIVIADNMLDGNNDTIVLEDGGPIVILPADLQGLNATLEATDPGIGIDATLVVNLVSGGDVLTATNLADTFTMNRLGANENVTIASFEMGDSIDTDLPGIVEQGSTLAPNGNIEYIVENDAASNATTIIFELTDDGNATTTATVTLTGVQLTNEDLSVDTNGVITYDMA